jgi:hypothetical protein
MPFHWTVYDRSGEEIRETEDFASREEAEDWMRDSWSELAAGGGARVRLEGDDGTVYDMELGEG